jgi:hypothetical protein
VKEIRDYFVVSTQEANASLNSACNKELTSQHEGDSKEEGIDKKNSIEKYKRNKN